MLSAFRINTASRTKLGVHATIIPKRKLCIGVILSPGTSALNSPRLGSN